MQSPQSFNGFHTCILLSADHLFDLEGLLEAATEQVTEEGERDQCDYE